jgi:hypothetical protein
VANFLVSCPDWTSYFGADLLPARGRPGGKNGDLAPMYLDVNVSIFGEISHPGVTTDTNFTKGFIYLFIYWRK